MQVFRFLSKAFSAVAAGVAGMALQTATPLAQGMAVEFNPTAAQVDRMLDILATGAADPERVRQGYKVITSFDEGMDAVKTLAETQRALRELSGGAVAADPAHLLDLARSRDVSLSETAQAAGQGMAIAVNYARTQGLDLKSVTYMSPERLQAYSSAAYQRRLWAAVAARYGDAYVPQVLPAEVDGRPTLRLIPKELLPDAPRDMVPWTRSLDQDGDGKPDFDPDITIKSVGEDTDFGGTPVIEPTKDTPIAVLDTFSGSTGGLKNPAVSAKPQENAAECGPGTGQPCLLSSVSLHNAGRVQCSGVLVAADWVLTAAHCTCDNLIETASIGQVTPDRFGHAVLEADVIGGQQGVETPSHSVPVTGTRYYFNDLPGGTQRRAFCAARARFLQLPEPDPQELRVASLTEVDVSERALAWLRARYETYSQRDMVLLKLSRPLQLAGQSPVALWGSDEELPVGSRLWLAGFGRNDAEQDGGHKTILNGEMTSRRCGHEHQQQSVGCVPDIEMLFFDEDGSSDSCSGDSGAPLYAIAPDGPPKLVAIVSRAMKGSDCGAGGINVLTTPQVVRDWMARVIATHSN